MPGKPLPYIKTVRSRGHVYEYFVTGKVEKGRPVLRRLPARGDPSFGRSYAGMVAARHARENVKAAVTMADLSRAYQASPKYTRRSQSTQATYGIYLRVIDEAIGVAPVDQVERSDIVRLLDSMQDRPGAANMVLLVLRNLFAHAIAREWVKASPADKIELMEQSGEEHEPWPEQLVEAALKDPEVALPVALLYYTAQRIGDVCGMKWTDITDGFLFVQQTKTGKPLDIRLHRALLAELATASRHGVTILATPAGRPMPKSTLRQRLQRWAAKSDCKVVPHGLRKNAVNALLEAGNTVTETAAISGQSLALVEHYAKRRNNRRLSTAAVARWEQSDSARATDRERGKHEENKA